MEKGIFRKPKLVLVFNSSRTLIAVIRSLHSAAELTFNNLQAISFNCTGRYKSTGGYYFRHISPKVEIEISDLDSLTLDEYDKMSGIDRTYHPPKDMARRRELTRKKRTGKGKAHDTKKRI